MGRLEAGEAPGREFPKSICQFVEAQQIYFGFPARCLPSLQPSHGPEPPKLRLNKLILDCLPGASPASSLPTARNHQNQFVEAQQIDFGFPARCLPASSLPTARNHQNQFVEPQQIDFGGSGPWEGWRLGGTGQGIQNQFVEPQQIDFGGSGPWEGWRLGRHRAGNPKSIC